VSFDALGLMVATAVMGKPGENVGDQLSGFSVDLSQAQIDQFYDAGDPRPLATPLLGNATARVVYDVNRFYNTRTAAPNDPSQWLPAFAATIARETHFFDLAQGQSRLQLAFSHSDGFGREIQKKILAEPGPVIDQGPVVDPRWVGTRLDNLQQQGQAGSAIRTFLQPARDRASVRIRRRALERERRVEEGAPRLGQPRSADSPRLRRAATPPRA
jgi:hypothetical protein